MLALIVLLSAVMVECKVIICGFSCSIRPDQHEPVVELWWVQNFSAQKNADDLNISLTLTGTEGESAPTEFEINGVSQSQLTNLTVYLNGTSVASDGTLPLFVVESGEVFGVNLV